jgi:hypothetical protein
LKKVQEKAEKDRDELKKVVEVFKKERQNEGRKQRKTDKGGEGSG